MENSFSSDERSIGINLSINYGISPAVFRLIQFSSRPFFRFSPTLVRPSSEFVSRSRFNLSSRFPRSLFEQRSRHFYSARKLKIRIRLPAPFDYLFASRSVTVCCKIHVPHRLCLHPSSIISGFLNYSRHVTTGTGKELCFIYKSTKYLPMSNCFQHYELII